MNATLRAKDRQIVKAKIKGRNNTEIAKEVYPNQTPEAGRVSVSRRLQKPSVAQYMEQVKLQALKEHNITWSRIIKPISEALEAVRSDLTGDVHIDHGIRLRASKQAQELLEGKGREGEGAKEAIEGLADIADEVELQRILFKRK